VIDALMNYSPTFSHDGNYFNAHKQGRYPDSSVLKSTVSGQSIVKK
jgi:hypothetical protein